MQEARLAARLVRRAAAVARAEGARGVDEIRVHLEPGAGLSLELLGKQFAIEARGTAAEGASLIVVVRGQSNGSASTEAVLGAARAHGW